MEIPFELPCSNCGRKIKTNTKRLSNARNLKCPYCRIEHTVDPRGFRSAQQGLDKFERDMKKLNRDLKRMFR